MQKTISSLVGAGVMASAGMVMFAWILNVHIFNYISLGWIPMQFNTAVCFFIIGIRLIYKSRFHHLFPLSVFIIASLTLIQDLAAVNFGIDDILMSGSGRMSPASAISFMAGSLGSIVYYKFRDFFESLIAAPLGISAFALAGYASGSNQLYAWGDGISAMGFHTALLHFIVALTFMGTGIRNQINETRYKTC